MICDFCGASKGDGSRCYNCEKQWEDDLRNNKNISGSILQKIKNLPVEQKKKVFPLLEWQYIRQRAREYGFCLQIAQGDERNPEVAQRRKEMENTIQKSINKTTERYKEVVNGVTKSKSVALTVNYLDIRYGKNF